MAHRRADKVPYQPHPNPHPETAGAPRTGIPVNPLPTRTGVQATPLYPKNNGFPK